MDRSARGLSSAIDGVVRHVILPITSVIPVLVRTGALFALFLALWVAFLGALVLEPSRLDAAWAALTALPLPVQAVAWLLFLPLAGGLWAWSTGWPLVVRVAVILAIAGWNVLAFLPRRAPTAPATPAATA